MNIYEIILIAIGLSMDAFAVAVCLGVKTHNINWKSHILIALFFGSFQGLMPLTGWALGTNFVSIISSYSHWIAALLLVFIGGKMLKESCSTCEDEEYETLTLKIKVLLGMAVATSIDALAAGVTFALFPSSNIIVAILLIALITFILSYIAVSIGRRFGNIFGNKAEILGGLVLIGIAIKIVLDAYL